MPKSKPPRRSHASRPPHLSQTSQAADPPKALTPDLAPTPANSWSALIHATELSLLDEIVARRHEWVAGRDRHPDADLLADCATVERINVQPLTITEEQLERAILRASVRRPTTLAGWRAKVEMARTLIQAGREPDAPNDDVDRMVPWMVLNDVLALLDTLNPPRPETSG